MEKIVNKIIDINCDMGENRGDDNTVIKYISSANIACGGHAGDIDTIKRTISLASLENVSIGAHPGYPDKENFGRVEIGLSNDLVSDEVLTQLDRFMGIANSLGCKVNHIKLHGALYNKAAADYNFMFLLANNIISEFGNIPFYTLANSYSEKAITKAGGVFYKEGFADRAYDDEGRLVSRKISGAVLHDIEHITDRVLELVKSGHIKTISGKIIKIDIDTICVHGDTQGSVQMVQKINKVLKENGFKIGSHNVF